MATQAVTGVKLLNSLDKMQNQGKTHDVGIDVPLQDAGWHGISSWALRQRQRQRHE
jgi:hypothetical protein